MPELSISGLPLLDFINNKCGGVATVASKASITTRAIYKWTSKNALPRTEFTNETHYSQILSQLSGVPALKIKGEYKPSPKKKKEEL